MNTTLSSSTKLMTAAFFALLALPMGEAQATILTLTDVPATHVYVPTGFDTNDNTEIVVTGYLPNLCYKAPMAKAHVAGDAIEIRTQAYKMKDQMLCAQMAVPFMETVSVGVLDKGDFKVTVNPGSSAPKLGDLRVTESTSPAIDDFVYANVSRVERIEGTRRVLLHGINPSNCYVLDEIKLVSNNKDAYSVLPIMKKVSSDCVAPEQPFTHEFLVPEGLAKENILLHVRVMSGKSVNTLFDNRD